MNTSDVYRLLVQNQATEEINASQLESSYQPEYSQDCDDSPVIPTRYQDSPEKEYNVRYSSSSNSSDLYTSTYDDVSDSGSIQNFANHF